MLKELLKNIETHAYQLGEEFADKYFGKDSERWWIAEEIGGVLYINDHFFSLGELMDFTRFSYSKKAMFEYKDYQMECHEKNESPINIKAFRHIEKK